MDVDTARSQVADLVQEVAALRMSAIDSLQRAGALRKIIASYVEAYPELAELTATLPLDEPSRADSAPRGAEAVRLILHEYPTRAFLVSELVDELAARGWLPTSDNPANAIRAALERLAAAEDSDVTKGRMHAPGGTKVVYVYDPDRVIDEEPF